jgi:hypothetical protein
MFKLTIPPTQRRLDYNKWDIWESLRQRKDYKREDCALCLDDQGNIRIPRRKEIDSHCAKWHLTMPLNPDLSFENLHENARERAKDETLGIDQKKERLRRAHRELEWIQSIEDFPNQAEIEKARQDEISQLEDAIKTIEDEFQSRPVKEKNELEAAWSNQAKRIVHGYFYLYTTPKQESDAPFVRAKKQAPEFFGDDAAFIDPRDEITGGKYLKITVNLQRSDEQIVQELRRVLAEEKAHYQPERKILDQRSNKKLALKVWDLAVRGCSPKTTAAKLGVSEKTARRQHKTAWRSVYPEQEYSGWPAPPTARSDQLTDPCENCADKECITTMRPCIEAEIYYGSKNELKRLIDGKGGFHAFGPADDGEEKDHESYGDKKVSKQLKKEFRNIVEEIF